MSSASVFTDLRRRRSPLAGSFFTPSDLTGLPLVRSLASVSGDLVTAHSSPATPSPFQRRNTRLLLLKVKILLSLFEFLMDSSSLSSPSSLYLSSSAVVCLRELYIILFRSRLLLDYCSQSSRLWLLIQNPQISGHFHDLNKEIATVLDVLPVGALGLPADLQEQLRLLRRQSRRSKLYIDPRDELLRRRIFLFLDEFAKGRSPDRTELRTAFVDRLGIRNAQSCRFEIDFLEEQIRGNEEDFADPSVLGGIVALARYCRFSLFKLAEGKEPEKRSSFGGGSGRKSKRRVSFKGSGDLSLMVPKDFCCPISLDIMRDPVTVSTGQTYDRPSITQWMEEGHRTCPNSGQTLSHRRLVPNLALRSLISQWCSMQGLEYGLPGASDASSAENVAVACSSRAAVEANRATTRILVRKLEDGLEAEEAISVRELRLLAKTGKENRACIAEAGAIPLLTRLMSSSDAATQENSVTAILNLSIHDGNKSKVMEEEGCLRSVVSVLRQGKTMEAQENAAATLFSLSAVHDYKKRITDEPGAVEALAGLLRNGSQRGKRDAVTALFNLSTHPDCCLKMMESGAVWALLEASSAAEGVAEEAVGALGLLMRQQIVAEVVGNDDTAVGSLIAVMRRGTPKAKENAVAALHELCKSGGAAVIQRLAKTPALGGLIQTLLLTGTKRARRKAASLARMCQSCEPEVPFAGDAGWGMEYATTRSNSMRQGSSFVGGGDVSVSVAVSVL
ncbi:U-box domain-containing protein 17-like [Iris pallida]|uniref:RING-type E3 ubiquitin transferase n=1 Tax=Iris pallida TaxID=29817 RepID=A0AAX6GQ14_IRIPA|nr:U-box domain-containing protein 17-like [Iris pallida]KAJ6830407.1 U-box domain-containing protein 17-like [Iris pallida]